MARIHNAGGSVQCLHLEGNFLPEENFGLWKPLEGNRPLAHDVTAPVTMHLEDKLAIYA